MNQNLKIFLIIVACIIIAIASLAYGAMTAPGRHSEEKTKPSPTPTKTAPLTKTQLEAKLVEDLPAITAVLTTKYPLIATDYNIEAGKLFDQGQWFGTTLSYKGIDTDNRDTLRVLMQKKDGAWILRTNPPRPLLSQKDFPDVPKDILKKINQPVSLPGTDSSPTIGS